MIAKENIFDFNIDGKPLHNVVASPENKIMFFDKAIKEKREISAFHLNDVFCEFSDLFYKGKNYKLTMSNFKKYMEYSGQKHLLKIYKMPIDKADRAEFGIRKIWSLFYEPKQLKKLLSE